MANEEHVALIRKGVEDWNQWRLMHISEIIDLSNANLDGITLVGADLWNTNLCYANLQKADLRGTKLNKSNLEGADLSQSILWGTVFTKTNLSGANLSGADFWTAYLDYAELIGANLFHSNFRSANLQYANLERTNLYGTIFNKTWLVGAQIENAQLGDTIFANVDLGSLCGLERVKHLSSSFVNSSTIQISRGKIPKVFLRGCGLSDLEIESAKLYQPGLSSKEIDDILYRVHDLRAGQALQINPLFISYSHKDGVFVDEMEKHLNEKGVRFWRDIHDATSGRLEKVVDRAMRQNPTVLLVLSEHSVQSDWVEHEARSARDLEKELKRDVLCPVALDGAWKDCNWPARLREQIMEYSILDFSNWKDEAEFSRKFAKLVEGLDLFYKEK